jgi:energy-converting hydrogenase Eha subunit G
MMIDDRTAVLLAGILGFGAVVETAAYYYCKNHNTKSTEPLRPEQISTLSALKWAAISSWLALLGVSIFFGPQILSVLSGGSAP